MTLRVVTDPGQLVAVRDAWEELAASAKCRPFTHPYWCLPWFRRLGQGRPFVVTVEEGGALVALGPFYERRSAGLGLVRFLGHGLGAVSAPLVAPGHDQVAGEVWAAALAKRRFAELLEYDGTGAGLDALTSGGRPHQVAPRDVCPVIRIEGTLDSWWQRSDRELRRVLRRAERALEAAGSACRVELVRERDELEPVLGELVKVHDAAEEANPRQHLLSGRWAAFTRDLLASAADAGRLRLFVLRVDGQAASFTVMLVGTGTMAMWLNRFDPAFAAVAPGHLTLRAVVEHAFAEGIEEVDLLIGAPRYKRLWCEDSYETLTVHAASSPAVFRAGRLALSAAALRRGRGPRPVPAKA